MTREISMAFEVVHKSPVRVSVRTVRLATLALALAVQALLGAAHGIAAPQEAPEEPAVAHGPPILPGQFSSKFGIDSANPEATVPTDKERMKNPLEFGYYLQDLLEQADQAQKRKDYSAVVRYYRAVAKAVPESGKSWSKLCEAYERVNDRERAIRACKYAIDRRDVELGDFVRYVHLILGQQGELGDADRTEVAAVLEHLETQEGTVVAANHLRCELGVRLKDIPTLEGCTKQLSKLAPDDPKTAVFQWSLAVMKGQEEQAQDLLMRARATGVMRESIERMEAATPSSGRTTRRVVAIAGGAALLAMVIAAALFTVVRRRRGVARGATA